MRKVFVEFKTKMTINVDEGIAISDVMDSMEYDVVVDTPGADLVNFEFEGYEVVDSK